MLDSFDLKFVVGGEETPIRFEAAAANIGWNKLGDFSVSEAHVRLEVGTRSNGEIVVTDATRWLPAD